MGGWGCRLYQDRGAVSGEEVGDGLRIDPDLRLFPGIHMSLPVDLSDLRRRLHIPIQPTESTVEQTRNRSSKTR